MSTIKPHLIYALAASFLCFEMALQVSPGVMTSQLMRDLHIDAAGIGLMSGFYFYSYTLLQIPVGLLFDRLSAKLLISIAVVLCSLGAIFFGMTHSIGLASLGRFLMGIGSSFAFIGVLVIAAHWYDAKYFALLVGVAQLLAALGAMGGVAPLASAVDAFGWRSTITVLALFGLVLALLIALVLQDHPKGYSKKLESHHQLGIKNSLLAVLGNKQTWWVGLFAFSNWAPITIFASLWGVPYLTTLYKISNPMAASAIAMIWIGIAAASPILGWLSDRIGRRVIFLIITSALGMICSFIVIWVAMPYWLIFPLLFGFGMAAGGQILSFAVVKDFSRHDVTATAIGFNNMAVVAGGALFQPLVGWLLSKMWDGTYDAATPVYSVQNYQYALLIVPGCFLVGILVSAFLIRETYCGRRNSV